MSANATSTIDPTARARGNVSCSFEVPIVLSDGRTWHLAKPRIQLRPTFGPAGAVDFWAGTAWPDYDTLLERYDSADDGMERRVALVLMARHLILVNYDLTDDEVGSLLMIATDDPANDEMWDRLRDAALGMVPKAGGPTGPAGLGPDPVVPDSSPTSGPA